MRNLVVWIIVGLAALSVAPPASADETRGFQVCACIEEIPGEGGCAFIGAPVTLAPLDAVAVGPLACFSNVPPGDYIVRASCGANPFGCPRPTHVTVVDSDVSVHVPAVSPCPGHCSYSLPVRISDLIRCVAIGEGRSALSSCWACDRNYDDTVSIDELVLAVGAAQDNCTDQLPFH